MIVPITSKRFLLEACARFDFTDGNRVQLMMIVVVVCFDYGFDFGFDFGFNSEILIQLNSFCGYLIYFGVDIK